MESLSENDSGVELTNEKSPLTAAEPPSPFSPKQNGDAASPQGNIMAGWMDGWPSCLNTEFSVPLFFSGSPQMSTSAPGGAGRGAGRGLRRTVAGTTARCELRSRPDVSFCPHRRVKGCLFAGQDFRSFSAGFETDASAQNHLPGRSDPKHACQSSTARSQAGGRRPAGKTGSFHFD